MSNLTIRQAVQGMLKLQDSGDHATMVGIGPMSPNLIQAVFELAKDEDFPPMFIASRNQVDMDEMGAGYVNGWDQTRFAADIKKVADKVIYIPRVRDTFMPITASVPLQLLARAVAVNRGCDVDQPRNLAKSVTVE